LLGVVTADPRERTGGVVEFVQNRTVALQAVQVAREACDPNMLGVVEQLAVDLTLRGPFAPLPECHRSGARMRVVGAHAPTFAAALRDETGVWIMRARSGAQHELRIRFEPECRRHDVTRPLYWRQIVRFE
jgi:hypothetical protein